MTRMNADGRRRRAVDELWRPGTEVELAGETPALRTPQPGRWRGVEGTMLKFLQRLARPRVPWFASLVVLAGATQADANPYRAIALRNAFHLVPAVVVVATPEIPPLPPLPEIALTGIVRADGIPKALLEIKEPKSKDAAPSRPPPLEAG